MDLVKWTTEIDSRFVFNLTDKVGPFVMYDCHTGDTHLLEKEVLPVLSSLGRSPKSPCEILDIIDGKLTPPLLEKSDSELSLLENMLYTLREAGLVKAI